MPWLQGSTSPLAMPMTRSKAPAPPNVAPSANGSTAVIVTLVIRAPAPVGDKAKPTHSSATSTFVESLPRRFYAPLLQHDGTGWLLTRSGVTAAFLPAH